MTTETVTTETEVSKKSRNADTRDAQQRVYLDSENWLDIPNHIEAEFLDQGFKLGWLRITINGGEDHKAVGKKINDGPKGVAKGSKITQEMLDGLSKGLWWKFSLEGESDAKKMEALENG